MDEQICLFDLGPAKEPVHAEKHSAIRSFADAKAAAEDVAQKAARLGMRDDLLRAWLQGAVNGIGYGCGFDSEQRQQLRNAAFVAAERELSKTN